jgi:hypothetical protein
MNVKLTFKESNQTFKPIFKEVVNLSGGKTEEAYANGYADGEVAGRQEGYSEGFNQGKFEGHEEGYVVGKTEGYDSGYTQREAEWWETLIPKDGFDSGVYLFSSPRWTDDTYNPPHAIKCKNANQMFYNNPLLTDTKVPIEVTESLSTTFRYSKLKRIMKVIINENVTFSYTFSNMASLEELYFEGVIGQNGLNFQVSGKLTHDSLMSVINCLKDYSEDTSGTEWVVTLGSANIAKLTTDELSIARNKGWTVN